MLGGDLQHRREVDAAFGVAGHGEDAAAHAFEERQVLGLDLRARPPGARSWRGCGRRGACSLRASSAGSAPPNQAWPVSSSSLVAGPVAAMKASISCGALDDRAHVVVIDEGQALGGGELGDRLDVGAELRPLVGGAARGRRPAAGRRGRGWRSRSRRRCRPGSPSPSGGRGAAGSRASRPRPSGRAGSASASRRRTAGRGGRAPPCSAAGSVGNLWPFSMPSKPISPASRRHCSSGMSAPRVWSSSFDQAMGLVP